MALKHKITINVTEPKGRHMTVLRGAQRSIPERLVRFLFGDFTQVYLLAPGRWLSPWMSEKSKKEEAPNGKKE